MEVRCTCLLLAAAALFAQSAPDPAKVIATINGRPVTAGEYDRLLAAMTPEVRAAARKQPAQVLEQFALFETILAEAEKAKLDQQSPYREQLADARRQIMVQAQIASKQAAVVVPPEDIEKAYQQHRSRYAQAKTKVIFLSRMTTSQTLDGKTNDTRAPDHTRKLAAELRSRLNAGEDFVALAKKYSEDGLGEAGGDFPDVIRPNSATIPAEMRDAILAAKPGDLLGPFEHQTGFYLFRVESAGTPPIEQVRAELDKEIRDAALRDYLAGAKSRSTVKIEPGAFTDDNQ